MKRLKIGLAVCTWEDSSFSKVWRFQKVTLAVLLAVGIPLCFRLNVLGQEGKTDIAGLQVAGWLPSGKPDKPSCTFEFTFSGSRISANADTVVSNISVVRAVDDTGKNLLWTDPSTVENAATRSESALYVNDEREWETSVILKSPSAEARSLQFEGYAELFTPTIPRVVFTNVAAYSGEYLKEPLLDQFNIHIKVLPLQNGEPQTIAFECEDPNHKLLETSFQHRDGTPIHDDAITSGEMKIGTNRIWSYTFKLESLQDINLTVRLDVPLRREATHFKIGWPRLPWIQPTNLEVVSIKALTEKKSTRGYCLALATFQGGLLTNALGIRKVSITKAEDDASNDITTVMDQLSPYGFDAREKLEDGGSVTKGIWLQSRSSRLKIIKTLEGDAELFCGGPGDRVMVDLRSDLKPGDTITSPELKQKGVSFTFVGPRNFNKTDEELNSSSGLVLHSWFRKEKETPEDLMDSLLFSYEDPKSVLLSHFGLFWEFLDAEEWRTSPNTTDYTQKFWLFRFDKLPKKGRVVVYVVNPSAIRRVHFKAENIPVR